MFRPVAHAMVMIVLVGVPSPSPTISPTAVGAARDVVVTYDGEPADGYSDGPSISADGTVVAYASTATNIVPNDTGGHQDIFVVDLTTRETTMASIRSDGGQANGNSWSPRLDRAGDTVTFVSVANNLSASDADTDFDVYRHDLTTGETVWVGPYVPHEPVAALDDPDVRVFASDDAGIVPGDTNGVMDVFVEFVAADRVVRVSVSSTGAQGDGASYEPSIDAEGRLVVFASEASNLVAGDRNGFTDVFVRDLRRGSTRRISDTAYPADRHNAYEPVVSADGSIVVYTVDLGELKTSETLVAYSLLSGEVQYLAAGLAEPVFDDPAYRPAVSETGDVVAYTHLTDYVVDGEAVTTVSAVSLTWGVGVFTDIEGSEFESDIEWLYAQGVTRGCTEDSYCPDGLVTRGQMAAFLVRALELEESAGDAFSDDDDSVFESDIDRLAASGIGRGCGPDRFCPEGVVNRGQMAAFLARALDLPPGAEGSFADATTSIFEDDIERIFAADITRGCNPPINDRYCPDAGVTRAQMAAMLHRALG